MNSESPLRKFFEKAVTNNSCLHLFSSIPHLKFNSKDLTCGGDVERLALFPITKNELNYSNYEAIGSTIGMFCWFGIVDLHSENIFLGKGKNGELIFTAIDIESIFEDLVLPTQTHLFPSTGTPIKHCGLKNLLDSFLPFNYIAALCKGLIRVSPFVPNYRSGRNNFGTNLP